jgi:hypothetical protein
MEKLFSCKYVAAHDSTIFTNSRLYARFEMGQIRDGYLLGDGGYPSKPYLLTPLVAPNLRAEMKYNSAQIRTRNPVERAFGVLKRRFPCLRMGLRVKVRTMYRVFNNSLFLNYTLLLINIIRPSLYLILIHSG